MIQNKFFHNIVTLLLSLLIVSFAFKGLSDVFKKKAVNYAVKIENMEYRFSTFQTILQKAIKEVKIRYGKDFINNELSQLKYNKLDEIINSTLILLAAKELGIVVNDNMVKKEMLNIPAFFQDGRFNKDIFDKTIKTYSESEQSFIEQLKGDVIREIFFNSLSFNEQIVSGLTRTVLQSILQTREAELITIPFTSFKIPLETENSKLKSIYEKNKYKFIIPEKRTIEYIVISPYSLKQVSNNVQDEVLKKIYTEKNLLFISQEKRYVEQIQFKSFNDAKHAREALINGQDLKTVAKKYAPDLKNYNLGIIRPNDFNNEILGKLFNLQVGDISEIIETPLGLYIFKIEKILPQTKKSFKRVKALLKKEYLKNVHFNKFLTKIKEIQNELKKGKDLKFIAQNFDQHLKTISISNLVNEDQKITQSKVFLENSFKVKVNRQSDIFPIDSDRFCILKVNNIVPEKRLKYDQVKLRLYNTWYRDQITSFVNRINISNEEEINSEANIKLFNPLKIYKTKIQISNKFLNPGIGLDLYQAILDLKMNSYTKPFIDLSKTGVILAKLMTVELPSEKEIEKYRLLYEPQINQMEQKILFTDVLTQLKAKFLIKVNPKI